MLYGPKLNGCLFMAVITVVRNGFDLLEIEIVTGSNEQSGCTNLLNHYKMAG